MKIKHPELARELFIHSTTLYKRKEYKGRMAFSGFRIVKDKWMPLDMIMYFDPEGNFKIRKLEQA